MAMFLPLAACHTAQKVATTEEAAAPSTANVEAPAQPDAAAVPVQPDAKIAMQPFRDCADCPAVTPWRTCGSASWVCPTA